MSKGWIKIHRQITDWEWYDEPNTFRLFFHLLLKANHKQNKYRGVTIEVGQIMTGFDKLANETGLTLQKVRTSINRLKSTNEITIKTSSKGSIIQIVNYKKYQVVTDEEQTTNKQITNDQQTNDKQITTNKNDNNDNNDKELKEIPEQAVFLEYARSQVSNNNLETVRLKYQSWLANDWRDGNDKEIKNWKLKLCNTLPYLKKDIKNPIF